MDRTVVPLDRLMCADEVGEYLQVRAWYVHELVRKGHLHCVQLGKRKRRFRHSDVVAFIEERAA